MRGGERRSEKQRLGHKYSHPEIFNGLDIFKDLQCFRSLTKEERLERDLEHMPAAKRRRLRLF